MKYLKILYLFILMCVFNSADGQKLSMQETVDYINESLKSFESNRAYGYWMIKVINHSSIRQINGTQILTYNIKDIETIQYLYKNGEHLIQLKCKGNTECIRNENSDGNIIENWDYLMISIVTKSETEKLVNAFLHLKSIVPNSPFDKK